jgi:two-component system KDP operon response regulator KdpE
VRDGGDVRLTKTEWALLDAFAGHPGKLLTHGWLLQRVWGEGYVDDVDVLRVFVSQLRKKLEVDATRPAIVVTEPGAGYRWMPRPDRERSGRGEGAESGAPS